MARNQRRESVDPARFEELEAVVSAMRAHMIPNDRIRAIEQAQRELGDGLKELESNAKKDFEELKDGLEELRCVVNLVKVAMGKSATSSGGQRAKVPEPQRFEGNRDGKELENFLFDMEQYFRAMGTSSKEDKVFGASMYLAGDAKLWWRSTFSNGVCSINTWGDLKKELMDLFFPENVEYVARNKLSATRHLCVTT
ncbi:hypothetical protein HRI_002341400 [Hibiscus trionum]|uniref:Retrotransposon gag domain-containing protein n=1 Tax=Hibiscus trionum TaxID=183268 RepID=A0A9W7M403_HIBTR|nr:hypothetical protein HRI_002341400 [Hibiscus trionum]